MDGLELFGKPEEQLAAVNEAIYAVLKGGQSYQIRQPEADQGRPGFALGDAEKIAGCNCK